MNKMKMKERRGYERLSLDGYINLKGEKIKPGPLQVGLQDISFGGFASYGPQELEVDNVVEFELTTQLIDRPILGKGRIRHINKPQRYIVPIFVMGVEFIEVDKDMLLHLIKRQQLKKSQEANAGRRKGILDFMPY